MPPSRSFSRFLGLSIACAVLFLAPAAHAALTIEPLTWNVVGLDSNTPTDGPNRFPVGARVCSSVNTTNVSVSFVWDSANAFINLRPGSLSTILIPSISAGDCADAYFEVEVDKNALAFDTARRYHITATDFSGTVSTPTPREIYVEHLISQSRNSISDVKYGTDPMNLTSVAPGGSMSLVVGNTYTIQLLGGTATQGYNQFEAFINFPNTIFQVLAVETTYSANNSPYVTGPAPLIHDQLYADACLWENDPNSPNYRSCVGGDFKSGGSTVITTYTIKIIGGGGTSEALNTLLYDFSGSSFHYNADFATGARVANIIDPASATISKSFSPNPTAVNGISVLTFTLTNPNPGTLGGYNFVDNLPANLQVAATPGVTSSGCGTPTITANAGASSITFANGTLAANATCLVNVNVTPTATGTFNNTTNNLFIGTIDTGDNAAASLTVNTDTPGTGLCGVTLASWTVPNGTTANPPDLTGGVPTVKAANVATATAAAFIPAGTSIVATSGHIDTTSWRTWGYKNDGQYIDFTVNTSNYTAVQMSFWVANPSPANGPTSLTVQVNNGGGFGAAVLTVPNPAIGFTQHTINLTGLTNTTGNTIFRIAATGANADTSGAALNFDDITFTGCTSAVDPTFSKSFSPDPIAVNGTSTLTFTITNTNAVALNNAKFIDTLPAGVQVAAVPAASTTCTGSPSWAPTAGSTTLNFGQTTGAIIPASGSCTVSVNVTATTGGPHSNVSGFLSTTETGTVNGSIASDTLTAVLPPAIDKLFSPSPILPGGTSTLTFTLTNPNQNDALSGVAFTDTFPVAPGAMTVASVPGATTSGCGAPTFSPAAGAGSVSFSGGTLAPGGTCTVTVNVTAPVVGTYANTSGNVSHVINAQTVNGNTASDSLDVDPPSPSIALLKQVSTSPSGPWTSFIAVPTGASVHFRFTVENTGDVPLTNISISDDTLNVATCNAAFTGLTLPVAVPANDNHIVTCVAGPVVATAGSHTNTATASGTFNAIAYPSDPSSAIYATTGLTLDKTSVQTSFTVAGDPLNYNYLVTNSGFAPLVGPVTVSDDKATVTCPAVTTVGDLDNFLDPGESVTCTATYFVTAGDVAAGFVTNTATASADGVSSPPDSVTVISTLAADVSVVKTLVTTGPYYAGQSVTYTLFVENNGPSTATNVQVNDGPSNLSITSVSGGGCVALPCTIPSIASGGDATITVTATITAAGVFDNTTTVDADQPDPVPANNTDSVDNDGTAAASADVEMEKILDTAGPYYAGQSITYSLFIINFGPSTATNVDVTDTPSNLTITGVSGGGCVALPCTIPSILATADTTITVTATIIAAGAFDNTADAFADEFDPVLANNTDSAGNGNNAAPAADVSMDKDLVTAGPYTVGQTVTYTLTVANAGPSTATNVQVTDTPSNLSITGVSGSGCAALPCTIPSIPANTDTVVTVTATITADGAFDNEATAIAAELDPNLTDNTDDDGNNGSTAVSADVSILKTLVTAGPYTPGQSITYTLFVENGGLSTATNVQVTDTPSNLSITGVSGAGCAALPCTIPSIVSGGDETITVTATITAAGAFDNVATVDADEPDPDPDDNEDDEDNGGNAVAANVGIEKIITTAGPYYIGQSITFTLDVNNAGPSTATSVQVADTPSNMTITGVSGSGCAALPCTIPSILAGTETTITVTATLTAVGPFGNTATANGAEPDPDSSDNTDTAGDESLPSADVSMDKDLVTQGPYTIGQSITYTLTVANAGPSTATNVQVTDTPTNLTITNVSGSGCAALPCTIPSIPANTDTVITVTATIDAAAPFDNTASANGAEHDPDPDDNTDDDGNNGIVGASANVSIEKIITTAGPYYIGQSVTFTLEVGNLGPSVATSVQVADMPSNMTITGVSGSGCAALPCTIPSIPVGTDTTITVTATLTAVGSFGNTATANGAEPDPDPDDNTDTAGGESLPSADVSMDKDLVTPGPYTIGQSITYTLTVANAGPSTATAVQVTDTPTNLTITNVSGSGCAALPCTIPSILSTADTVITVTATIDAAAPFDNTASANGAEHDPDPDDNTDDDGNNGIVGASANVGIEKIITTAGPYYIGQSITFTLDVNNAGPSTATSVQVADTPSNMTITGVSGSGCAALPCTIPSILVGTETTITVTATLTAVGSFGNTATANGADPDPDPDDNTDTAGGESLPSADVSMDKDLVTAGPFSIGQSITYTLTVANAGPSTATAVEVTDTPTNLTITNVSGSGCAALPCTIPSIPANTDTVITVTATIDAAAPFDNTASANGAEHDPDPDDNTDDDGNNGIVGASANVSIEKIITTAGPYYIGQSVTFTLEVGNLGPSVATSVQVADTPSNMTITGVSGSGCAALPCTIPSIPVGTDTTITVTATLTAVGSFGNTATANGAEPDPDPDDNTDTAGGESLPSADVSMDKDLVTPGPYTIGQSITYTLTVANAGPSTATAVQVTDTPTNLTIISVSGSGCAALPCTIPSINVSADTTITITATINAAGAFDNSATATGAEHDPNLTDDTDDDGNNGIVGDSADVSIVKTLTTGGPFSVGQSVSYTLLVANAGPSTATSVQVTDTPTNLAITSVSGSGCAALPCTIPSINSEANTLINVTATILAAGAFDNSATATSPLPDPDPVDNTDDDDNGGSTTAAVDIAVVKTSSAPNIFIGQSFSFTIVVTNNGPDTATNVTLSDPLPANFALDATATTQGSCAGTTTVNCSLGTMLNGSSVTITLTGHPTAPGAMPNTATVVSNESEAVTANNSSSSTPMASHGPEHIPTASEWGLILLALFLGAAGVLAVRTTT